MTGSLTARKLSEDVAIAEAYDFLDGLNTSSNPRSLPSNALTQANNVEYFRNILFRRNGFKSWSPGKPDSNPILGIFPFSETTTGLNILRFTKNKIYRSSASGWIEYTPDTISANSGSNTDFFQFVTIDDRGFFTNGVDPIREVDSVAHSYKQLGNAPVYKYITAAFNRIIGASLIDTPNIPYQYGWCGESNYDEWDESTDISAGHQKLTSSPTGLADDITGLFSIGQYLIIPRSQSIWLATHTGSSTTPFNSFSALPHIGADLPRTITLTDYGLIWVENKSSSVFVWVPGTEVNEPNDIDISHKIKRQLAIALRNADEVWASYSHDTRTYSIYITYGTQTETQIFRYNFLVRAWVTETINLKATVTSDVGFSNSSLTINDLSGTISGLMGTINGLGGLTNNTTRVVGFSDGQLATQSPFSGFEEENGTDIQISDQFESGESVFVSTIVTKEFVLPPTDTFLNLVRFYLYVFFVNVPITLLVSKDGGLTWTILKQYTPTYLGFFQQLLQIRKALKAKSFMFKIEASTTMVAFPGFYIGGTTAGISK